MNAQGKTGGVTRSSTRRYGVALVSVASALVAVQMVTEWHSGTGARSLYFVAVLVSARYGGLGPGLLSTVLAALASAYLNLGTPFELDLTFGDVLQLAVFIVVAVVISSISARQWRAEDRLRIAMADLSRALEHEAMLARTDALTGLPNGRSIEERIDRVGEVVPDGTSAVGVIDLDHFKTVNDRYGHAEGDEVLVKVGRAIRSCIRATDVAARLGGDEFLILFSSITASAARDAGRRIVHAVESISAEYPAAPLSASIGIAVGSHDSDIRSLIGRADEAMYEAKRLGKGRTVVGPGTVRPAAETDEPPREDRQKAQMS